jgi:hypothetical protein
MTLPPFSNLHFECDDRSSSSHSATTWMKATPKLVEVKIN